MNPCENQRMAHASSSLTDSDTPNKPRRKRWKIVAIVAAALVVALAAAAGILYWNIQTKFDQIETIEDPFPDETSRPEKIPSDAMNILLLGSDSRADASKPILDDLGNRSDTIMVMHIPADRSGVQVMSIMRDSYVEIPGHGEDKINHAMSYGGVKLMVQTVESIIDQRIDHVAVVDFNGFKGMTNALGGVEVNNPEAFNASPPVNTHFPAGKIKLKGDDALAYVRERKTFDDGDYTRVENQQRFLKAMFSNVMSRDVLLNPGKATALIDETVKYVATDDGVNPGFVFGLGQSMVSLKGSDITSFTLPTLGTDTVNGMSIVTVNWDEVQTLREKFAKDELGDYQPKARP